MKLSWISAAVVTGLGVAAALRGQNISLVEAGVGANEVVTISSSGVGNNLNVYSGVLDLTIDGANDYGFCIDPWHWSGSGTMTYSGESLGQGPDVADGMGATVAKEIEQLWYKYYSTSMSGSTAAGLQIAIWELVDQSISAQNSSYWFTLDSSNNYGASSMISWVEANTNATAANLVALTGSGQNYVTLQSNLAALAPVVTSGSVSGIAGQALSYSVSATNEPTGYTAASLPAGLAINATTGLISGTPTTGGTFTVPVTASNAGGTGSGTVTITIKYTLGITGSPNAGGTTSGAGTYAAGTVVSISQIAASGYRTNGWTGGSVASPSSAATTITMNANAALTAGFVAQGTLTVAAGTGGTATGSGTFDNGTQAPIAATVTNSDYYFSSWTGNYVNSASSASTYVTVNGNETVTANFAEYAPVITSALTGSGIAGQAYSYTITATHHPTTYGAVNLPAGLSLNASTGVISGTPTAGGTFSVSLGAANSGGTGNAVLVLTIDYTLSISASPAAGGTTTGAGSYAYATAAAITATGNSGYRFNNWSGTDASAVQNTSQSSTYISMTANRSLIANFVQQGTLTVQAGTGGTATGGGTFDVNTNASIAATASSGYVFSGWTGSKVANASSTSTTITVAAGSQSVTANFTMLPPVITSALTLGDNLNEPTTSYTITATNNPTSFNAVGLPTGLAVNTATGAITGTPAQAGTFKVTISASNAGGTGSATLVLTVAQTYTLSITASPSAGGSFTGAGTYAPGTVVSISESSNSGYRTNGWGGGTSTVASPTSAATTVTMSANVSLTAQFVQEGVVSVTATAGGSATGGGTFDVGTAAPLTATAQSGYVFTGWTGSSDIANATSSNTTVNVTGAENLTANFIAAGNPEQLGTIVFPNAVPPGIAGVSATTSNMNAVVTNSGASTITVSSISTTGNFTAAISLPFTLAPGASESIPLTFAPQVLGLQTGLLTGVSNDGSNPVFQFVLEGTGVNPSSPPSATITAASTAYTGSPFYVSSTAFAPNNNLTQHTIEWMSPEGVWNVDTENVSGGNSSRTLGITFTETGGWTLRAGASVDGGQTWYYSPSVNVTVSSGLASYTFQSMAIPSGNGASTWYSVSPVVQQTYQVQHTNPTNAGN